MHLAWMKYLCIFELPSKFYTFDFLLFYSIKISFYANRLGNLAFDCEQIDRKSCFAESSSTRFRQFEKKIHPSISSLRNILENRGKWKRGQQEEKMSVFNDLASKNDLDLGQGR